MKLSAFRMMSGSTVRTRIIVLAVIPRIGFLANGTAFTNGQSEVEDAFDSVTHATSLAETSQELKNSLGSMRILVRDFSTNPSTELMRSFDDIHQASMNNMARIEKDAHAAARPEIEGMRR